VRPSAAGNLAIIAPSEKGTKNRPAGFARVDSALDEHGQGPLVEWSGHVMDVAQNPTLLIRPETDTDAVYGDEVTVDGAPDEGASAITTGSTPPLDGYKVFVEFLVAGTVGEAGITYKTSLDDGETMSATKSLSTDTSILIPDSGVTLELGAGDIAKGETVSFTTTAAQMSSTNRDKALAALRATQSPFEAVLVHGDADVDMVSQLDLWLKSMNLLGIYPTAVCTVRRKGAAESEADYAIAVAEVTAAAASTDVVVCADVGDVPSVIRGITMEYPMGLFLAARGMAITIGTDPAYVALGPLPGVSIVDSRNNPKHHDEALFPGIDDLRVATLRTFPRRPGAYITNANLISPPGSDWVYWQHARTMNEQCRIAHEILTTQLSRGVQKDPKPGPNGERYILEESAAFIEGLVNAAIHRELVKPGHVSEAKFTLARTDDISANGPATLTGFNEQVALAYVKLFAITSRFVREITVAQAA
jgi:hypothetical protein